MKRCINLGCLNSVPDKQFACSQACGYTHYVRKTLNEVNTIADKKKQRSFEFTVEQAKAIIDGYKQGKTVAQLAVDTGVYVQAISRFIFNPIVMDNFKIRRRRSHRKAWTAAERDAIRQDLDKGLTVTEIAAAHNSSLSAIYRFKVEYLEKERELSELEKAIGYDKYKEALKEQAEKEQLTFTSQPNVIEVVHCGAACQLRRKLLSFLGFNDAKREQKL